MADIKDIRDQLLRDEGLRLKPYTDSVGKLTIGVGRNLTDIGITQTEALFMLDGDIARCRSDLSIHLPWCLQYLSDAPRFYVLVNMCFNMGVSGLLGFKHFLAAFQRGAWDEAADAMLDSRWAAQVGPRAQRLALQLRKGVWQ